jgi:signal transduction histidine kinase/ActR/RegA family two-component response regulator
MAGDASLALRVLILAPFGRDAELMSQFLRDSGITTEVCDSAETLCTEITRGAGAVAVTDEVLTPETITRLAEVTRAQPSWSDIPLMLLTRQPSVERHVQSLGRLGVRANVTLVERPVRINAFASLAESLLRARKRQYEVRDLLAKMEELIAELNARVHERDRFLAVLGHELRTPLTAIALATELTDAQGRLHGEHLQAILRQTRTLTQLVNDLLDVSRITTGKIVLSKERIDLVEFARAAATNVEPAARAHRISIDVHVPAYPVAVNADRTRLDQILANLLTNAVKYTPAGGRVNVFIEQQGDEAVIRVRDTGVGIAPDQLERVFDLFAQAENAIGRSKGGLGIGLALVKDLVALHGGTVSVASEGEGRGSEFAVRMPAARAEQRDRAMERMAIRSTPPRCTIVLIDDSDDLRELLRLRLQRLGQSVEVSAAGGSGVETILRVRPQLALIDIGLPDIDGYEVARRVRAALGDSVMLVALTGFGQPEDRDRAVAAGFDRHLTKPPDLRSIEQCIREAAGEGVRRNGGGSASSPQMSPAGALGG